ncbi:hypothetical protein HYDPIDRAFT_169335 [Hydnomerulius pinastri MD-312]|uniref:Uncharacterized protein n=1 Tax=Hydnomerulius pinastri MD-312 TaxID=994086 RepID=A0A0C9VV17_9AGAM|nr:hypothetical protein HYDPIDRAFT_169335 [Hydnomerulius pinastri MD-312]
MCQEDESEEDEKPANTRGVAPAETVYLSTEWPYSIWQQGRVGIGQRRIPATLGITPEVITRLTGGVDTHLTEGMVTNGDRGYGGGQPPDGGDPDPFRGNGNDSNPEDWGRGDRGNSQPPYHTPDPEGFRERTVSWYRDLIREWLDVDPNDYPDVCTKGVSMPEPYDGHDNIKKFEAWLQGLL